MPAHTEMQLISRIVRTGCMGQVVEWGITTNDFKTPDGFGMWVLLSKFYTEASTHKAVLGLNSIHKDFPNFELCDDEFMTLEALCKVVRETRLILDAKEYLDKGMEEVETDPMPALLNVRRRMDQLIELGDQSNLDVSFSDAINTIVEDYEKAESGLPMSNVLWPWDLLNEEMGGLMEDDYVVLYGRPKSMKSWVLAYLIAHFFVNKLRVLVYTKEMTPTNILRRVAAAAGGLPYQEMRFGRMDSGEKDTLLDIRELAQSLAHRDNLWCLSGKDTPQGGTGDTIPWLHTKVEKYKPDIVLIDGLYLMSTGRPNQKDNIRVQTISRECRQMVLDNRIPVIATAQANRGAAGHYEANLDEIAHSDAIGQDATAAFRVINEKTDHEVNGKKVNTVILATAGSREFRMDGFRIVAEPATNFNFHSPVSSKELETAKEKDSEPEDATKTKKRAPAKSKKQKELDERKKKKLQEQLDRVKNN